MRGAGSCRTRRPESRPPRCCARPRRPGRSPSSGRSPTCTRVRCCRRRPWTRPRSRRPGRVAWRRDPPPLAVGPTTPRPPHRVRSPRPGRSRWGRARWGRVHWGLWRELKLTVLHLPEREGCSLICSCVSSAEVICYHADAECEGGCWADFCAAMGTSRASWHWCSSCPS